MAQWVKNLLAMQEPQETLVQSLGQEDPPEKDMATHSSTLAWEIPWTEESGRPQSMGSQRVRYDLATKATSTKICSCVYYTYIVVVFSCPVVSDSL